MKTTRSLLIGFALFIVGGLLILMMQPWLFALGVVVLLAGVLVPLWDMVLRSGKSPKSDIVEGAASESRPAVLIVEDQANWRNTLQLALRDQYIVQSAASLSEARTILFESRQPYHVVVVDIRLDDTDPSNQEGLTLAEEIQRRLKGITTTIVITAYPSISSVKRAFQRGVFEYVEKYPEDGTGFDLYAFRNLVQEAAGAVAGSRGEVSSQAPIMENERNWQQTPGTMLEEDSSDVEAMDTYQGAE